LLAALAIHEWIAPWFPVQGLASCLILFFAFVSLCGVKWIMRLAMPLAATTASLGFLSAIIPIYSGKVDWHLAFAYHLTVPFPGWFGQITSVMAGLYLVGFAAPAFEQATSHVGETIDPAKNVPRAIFASALIASLYFIVLPVIWLGTLGPNSLAKDLATELGPTLAPLLGGAAKAGAFWFMTLNMFHGIIAALAGPPRALAQIAEDGLLPEFIAKRSRTDCPWVATLLTAAGAIICVCANNPLWLIAAANFTYLIGIALPSIAVWLLRKDQPHLPRPYRAPKGAITMGLCAAGVWLVATMLGFEQFGLPTVLTGIAFAYSGTLLYVWRKITDRLKAGQPLVARTLHVKLTGAMLLVLALDATGYLMAVNSIPKDKVEFLTVLADIFVVVAVLTISVGLVLPGMIAHAATQVSLAAQQAQITMADFSRAMEALSRGDLSESKVNIPLPLTLIHSRDEMGDMALNFAQLQGEIGRAAKSMEGARAGLLRARDLTLSNTRLEIELAERERAEQRAREQAELLDKASDAILVCDLSGGITYLNPAAKILYGRTLEDFAHRDGIELLFKDPADFVVVRDLTLDHREWSGELAQVTKEGRDLTLESRWTLLMDSEDVPTSILLINNDIAARKEAELALAKANERLRDLSRQAGMAEIATNVLHNVGNALNSVNVSTTLISNKLRKLQIANLSRVCSLLDEHDSDLGDYLINDPKGKIIPSYLRGLAKQAVDEKEGLLVELRSLLTNVDHIKAIVEKQQSYARKGGFNETVKISAIVEDSLRLSADALGADEVSIVREFSHDSSITTDKHKVLQILVNLINNAKQACSNCRGSARTITIRVSEADAMLTVAVADNGVGIEPGNFDKIFQHGFTTRKEGHGFGLHDCCLTAKDLGGKLHYSSEGAGRGACFVLELPLLPAS
jgi:PAS domain S-box-containing protein